MARRILLGIGIVIVALGAGIITLLATSGGGSPLTQEEHTLTAATNDLLLPDDGPTLTNLALIDQATQTAQSQCCVSEHTHAAVVYTQTISALTQQAIQAQTAALDQTQTQQAADVLSLRGTLRGPDQAPLPGVGLRLYRDDGDGRFAPFAPDAFLTMITTGDGGAYDFGVLEPGTYWLEVAYYSLSPAWQAAFAPDTPLNFRASVPSSDPVEFALPAAYVTPSATPTATHTPPPTPTSTTTRPPTGTPAPTPTATLTPGPSQIPIPSPAWTLAVLITLTSTPEPGISQIPPTATATPEMIP